MRVLRFLIRKGLTAFYALSAQKFACLKLHEPKNDDRFSSLQAYRRTPGSFNLCGPAGILVLADGLTPKERQLFFVFSDTQAPLRLRGSTTAAAARFSACWAPVSLGRVFFRFCSQFCLTLRFRKSCGGKKLTFFPPFYVIFVSVYIDSFSCRQL